jgi:hypothetical protein
MSKAGGESNDGGNHTTPSRQRQPQPNHSTHAEAEVNRSNATTRATTPTTSQGQPHPLPPLIRGRGGARPVADRLIRLRQTPEHHRLAAVLSDLLNLAAKDDTLGPLESSDVAALLDWARRTASIGDYCKRCWRDETDDPGTDPTRWPIAPHPELPRCYVYRCHRCGDAWSCNWAELMLNEVPA